MQQADADFELNWVALCLALRFAKAQARPVFTFDLPASGNQAALQNGANKLCPAQPLSALLGAGSRLPAGK